MPSNSDWPLRTQYLTGHQGLHDRSAPPQPVFRTDDRGTLLIYVPCCFCLNVILIKLHRRMFQLASQHIRWRQGLRTPMLGCTQVVINPCPVGGPFPSNRSLTFFSFPRPCSRSRSRLSPKGWAFSWGDISHLHMYGLLLLVHSSTSNGNWNRACAAMVKGTSFHVYTRGHSEIDPRIRHAAGWSELRIWLPSTVGHQTPSFLQWTIHGMLCTDYHVGCTSSALHLRDMV